MRAKHFLKKGRLKRLDFSVPFNFLNPPHLSSHPSRFSLSVFLFILAAGLILTYFAAAEALPCSDCNSCGGGYRTTCATGEYNTGCSECSCTDTCDTACGATCDSFHPCTSYCSSPWNLKVAGTCNLATCTCTYYDWTCGGCSDSDWLIETCSGTPGACDMTYCRSCTGPKRYQGCSGVACVAPMCDTTCGASCTQNSDCPDKCEGNVRYESGWCNPSTCTCSYTTENCIGVCSSSNPSWKGIGCGAGGYCAWYECADQNGWYCNGNVKELRTYTCSAGACTYTSSQQQDCSQIPDTRRCVGNTLEVRRWGCYAVSPGQATCADMQLISSTDCNGLDGWYGGGDLAGCGADQPVMYKDYSCSLRSGLAGCWETITQGFTCDSSDICSNTCDGTVLKSYKDYYAEPVFGSPTRPACLFNWGSTVRDCAAGTATDTDGGDRPTAAGTCAPAGGCASGACTTGSPSSDTCGSGTQLTEYYNSGASCLSKAYACSSFETIATKVGLTCTPGTAAGCSGGAFSTSAGTAGGTDSCTGACPGCMYREFYTMDSADACPGNDSCAYIDRDPDASNVACDKCTGAGRWVPTIPTANKCCGDDPSEVAILSRQCDGFACVSDANDRGCCAASTGYCVWQGQCYLVGSGNPAVPGARCEPGAIWKDVTAPSTAINPNGGDYTASGTTSVPFTLSCTDTGGAGCRNSYYKVIDSSQTCQAGGFTTGTTGTVSCPVGQTCSLKVCFYSDDRALNTETIKQSNPFLFGPRVCDGRQCGQSCLPPATTGICDGPSGNCYAVGGCLLNCAVPSPGTGNERIWVNPACGRTGSYKCGPASVCGNSLTSCTVGGSSTTVTGNWAFYDCPSGSHGSSDTFQISLGGVTKIPAGFNILSECAVTRPDGSIIYFDNWGTGVTYSYAFRTTDPEGVWTVNSCSLWSDFSQNGGRPLKQDNTPCQFILDKSPPSITINNPRQNDVYAANFLVNATVTDTYSPISTIQYRWENTTRNGTWTGMTFNSGYYTANLDVGPLSDGNYSIKVRANDTVGNANEAVVTNVQIDRRPPDITVLSPVPGWYKSVIEVKARVSDSTVRYRWENSTYIGPWNGMIKGADGNYSAVFDVSSLSSGNYIIRIWANDTTGNEVNKTVDIGIDRTNPSSGMTSPAPGSTVMSAVFNISWTGADAHSGVRCHYVTYKYCDNLGSCPSTEYNATFPDGKCTTLLTYDFNPASELPITEFNNYTFFFRSVALDNAGNLESKTGWETNATIFISELVTFTVTETTTGATVSNGGKVANGRTVKVNVKAKQEVEGNLDITVYYYAHILGARPPQQISGWSSVSCTGVRECNASISIDVSEAEDKKEVDYFIMARAGSTERLPPNAPSSYFYYFVYNHPICNFLVNDVFRTVIGSSEFIAIEVRNIQNTFDNVGLRFDSVDSGLAIFIESGQQYLQVPLNPKEEKIIYARLIPSPPTGEEGLPLKVTGNSTADTSLHDEDSIRIVVGFPPNFSELGDFAAIAIVLLACLIYLKFVI